MKKIGFLFTILLLSVVANPSFALKEHVLIVEAPEGMLLKDYCYSFSVSSVESRITVWSCLSRTISAENEQFACSVTNWREQTEYKVTYELRIGFKNSYAGYLFVRDTVSLSGDTSYLKLPNITGYEEIDRAIRSNRRLDRRENFSDAMHTLFADWNSVFLYTSYYQGHRPFGEILAGPAQYVDFKLKRRSSGYPIAIYGLCAGSEFNFDWNEEFILGPKIGYNFSTVILNFGLHMVYYTDFENGSFCLKPRIGLNAAIPFVNLSYSYAIRFGPDYFGNRINQHQFCLNLLIPLKLD